MDSSTVIAVAALAAVAAAVAFVWSRSGRDGQAGLLARLAATLGVGGIGLALWINWAGPLSAQSFLAPVFAVGALGAISWAVIRLFRAREQRPDDGIPPGRRTA